MTGPATSSREGQKGPESRVGRKGVQLGSQWSLKYLRNISSAWRCLLGIECLEPEIGKEAWAGNGDLRVVSVDVGIEAVIQMGFSLARYGA